MSKDSFYVGTYWRNKTLNLREYADATRSFLASLQSIHPVFRSLEWIGNRSNRSVPLTLDLQNLDEVIYTDQLSRDWVYEPANPDGSPSWQSHCPGGFYMIYGSSATPVYSSVTVSIQAGMTGTRLWNSAVVSFPPADDPDFPYREFYRYDFVKGLFSELIACWRPDMGRVTSYGFSRAVSEKSNPRVGWLTYVGDQRAAVLHNDSSLKELLIEDRPEGGVLISLGQQILSPSNELQVERARLLMQRLGAGGFMGL